jgi:hypothetical protein
VREVFDIGAKDKAELKRSDWLKFDGSLFGGGGDRLVFAQSAVVSEFHDVESLADKIDV